MITQYIFLVFNRILAFSEAPITSVHVSVDGEPLGKGHSAGGPLYVLLWDPSLYLTGLHTIRVKVEVSTAFIHLPLPSSTCLETLKYFIGLDSNLVALLAFLCVRTRQAGRQCGSITLLWRTA